MQSIRAAGLWKAHHQTPAANKYTLPHKRCRLVMGQEGKNLFMLCLLREGQEGHSVQKTKRHDTLFGPISAIFNMAKKLKKMCFDEHLSSHWILSWGTKEERRCCRSAVKKQKTKTRATNSLSLTGGHSTGIFCCLLEGDDKKFVDPHCGACLKQWLRSGYIIGFPLI